MFNSDEEDTPSSSAATYNSEAFKQMISRLPSLDMNQLQTALATAVNAEDYQLAARIRDQMQKVFGADEAPRIDWSSLGNIPEWLIDRLDRLDYRFPTEVQRRVGPAMLAGSDVLVQSQTGSGKTLAFLVPALANLSYPPETYPDDLKGPQLLVLVPTLELGVQMCMLIFRMFGGNVNVGQPGDKTNIFTFTGPRGLKVRGVLNKEELVMAVGTAYLRHCHVVVGTPTCIAQVAEESGGSAASGALDHLRVICVDEVDACWQLQRESLERVLNQACKRNAEGKKPQIALVGATLGQGEVVVATQQGWIDEPVNVLIGEQHSVPQGLTHRYVVVDDRRRLTVLVRLLRADLEAAEKPGALPARVLVFTNSAAEAAEVASPLTTALWSQHAVSVLLPNVSGEPPAPQKGGPTISNQEVHESPSSGADAIRALHAFRDARSSLLLCPPGAARGIDLPAVTHVYNLGSPPDPSSYLHRAGRAGRIGSTASGVIVTLCAAEEVDLLKEMAQALNIQLEEMPEPPPEPPVIDLKAPSGSSDEDDAAALPTMKDDDLAKLKRGLEDMFNLL